jgi:sugar/nucleoside kinase (ribokinase family)
LFDIVSVGHFSIDSIFLPSRQNAFVVLGGSVTYVSLTARHLDSRVSVISRVGADFPSAYKWWLQQEGVDLSGVVDEQDALTTRFELRYENDLSNRSLCSKTRMPPIRLGDLPDPLKAKVIHLAPIAGEITLEVAQKLRSCAEVLSLEAQGMTRSFDEKGNVTLKPPSDKSILGLIDILKSTRKEIQTLTGLSDVDSAIKAVHSQGVNIVIVTLGTEGAVVSVDHVPHTVPAYRPEKLVDPTGAGDAFIGAFLAEYAQGKDCAWCSHVGSAAASLVVEGIGPTSLGDKDEIYRRARFLHEKKD